MMLGGFCGSARPEIAIAAPAAAVLRNVRRFPPTALKNERRFPLLLNTTSASHCSILISVEKLIIIIGESGYRRADGVFQKKRKEPVSWARLYRLPDFVSFSHKRHFGKAQIACSTCHAEVERQDVLVKEKAIGMKSCMAFHDKRKEITTATPATPFILLSDLGNGFRPDGVKRSARLAAVHHRRWPGRICGKSRPTLRSEFNTVVF